MAVTAHIQTQTETNTETERISRVDWKMVGNVATTFIITRLILFTVIYLSSIVIPVQQSDDLLYANPDNLIIDGLIRFDSWWYRSIILDGYSLTDITMTQQQNVAFFPLYPILVRSLSALLGDIYLSAIVVSNTAFLFALGYLYKLTEIEFDRETAGRTIFYFAAAPTAVFFSAMYVESLFVLMIIATFYHARRRQWVAAALAGALASATRNTGIIIAASIALEGIASNGLSQMFNLRNLRENTRSLLAAAFVPAGLLSYMAFLNGAFGDPLAFVHIQAAWRREVSGGGFTSLIANTVKDLNAGDALLAGQLNGIVLLDIVFTIAFGIICIAVAWKMRPSYSFFAITTFLIPLTTGSVQSMTRYSLMLIPCFMLLGRWGKNNNIDRTITAIFLPLMAYCAILFSHWYFAG